MKAFSIRRLEVINRVRQNCVSPDTKVCIRRQSRAGVSPARLAQSHERDTSFADASRRDACRKRGFTERGEGPHRFGDAGLATSESGVSLPALPNQPSQSRTLTRQLTAILLACIWLAVTAPVHAADTWQAALSRMPLIPPVTQLNRTNCVSLMLSAFQSNAVVKALIFMPGATDELYFYRRARAKLANANPTLLDAIVALTNQTFIRATFHPPLLLLYTTEDDLNVPATIKDKTTAARLRRKIIPGRITFNDAGWDEVRTALKKTLSVGLRPFSNAPDSWHFFRHNFAACGVSEWQLLESIALSDKTKFTVHWLTVHFRLDQRGGPPPDEKDIRLPSPDP